MTSNESNTKQFAVNWNNHMNHVKKAFDHLLNNSEFTDVTLYAEGKKVGAHKVLLSACSIYFRNLFREFPQEHPLVVLKGVRYSVLADILKFIYSGEVSVDSDVFDSFLQTAEFLQISGLTDTGKKKESKGKTENSIRNSESCDELPKVKRAKQNNFDENYAFHKEESKEYYSDTEYAEGEPEVMSSIFADEISDQERSQFPTEMLQASSDNYGMDETIAKGFLQSSVSGQYLCELCGKSYKVRDSLYKHLSVHAGYTTCTICSKVLSRKTHLDRHMIQTHGVQPNIMNNSAAVSKPS